MIKGINKQILEVTNPESKYFEKIIFFVRPEGQSVDENVIKNEAEKISLQMRKPPRLKRTLKQKLATAIYFSLGIGAGSALILILNTIIK